jgi:Phosphate-selective porin O and P
MRLPIAAAPLVALVAVTAPAAAQPAEGGEGQVMMTPPPAVTAPAAEAPAPPPPPATPPQVEPLSQAPAAAPAPPDAEKKSPTAGWIKGSGFILQSEDEKYRLRIGLQAGYRFEPVYQNGAWVDRNTFFVLRPFLGGNFLEKWIQFWTSFEFASNPPYLLDSYVEIGRWKEFALRVGQQWTPFDRHEYLGPQEILFPEWAPVSEYFWTGRDKGITAMGVLGGQLEYWAGVYSGTPLRQYNALPGNYVVEGRVTWSPLGLIGSNEFPYITEENGAPFKISATVEGYYGKVQEAAQNFNPSTFRFETEQTGETHKQGAGAADLWMQGRWFAFLAEGFVRHTTPAMGSSFTSVGAWGQLGVPLIERALDIATRINWLNASTSLSNDQFYSIEGQMALYASHSQHLVIKLRYAYGHQNSPGEAALGPVALILPAGRTQLGTLQLNLAF